MWRPALATCFMILAVLGVKEFVPGDGTWMTALLCSALSVAVGAASYVASLFVLWIVAGRPPGIEGRVLTDPRVRKALKWMRSR